VPRPWKITGSQRQAPGSIPVVTDVDLTDEQAAELDRWCDLLDRLCLAWTSTAGHLRTLPPSTSAAFREDALVATHRPGWETNDASNTGRDAAALVDAAACHLRGLRSLTRDRAVVLTLWPLARHVAEYAAQAGWLLDPEITVEQRVARRWLMKLTNVHRYRQTVASINASTPTVKIARNLRAQAEHDLLRRFPDAGDLNWKLENHPQGPPWTLAGQHVPGLGQMVRGFIKIHGFQQGHGMYDMLSLQSHPNLDVVVASLLEPVQHEGFVQVGYRVDIPQTTRVLRVAALMFYRAAMAVVSYFALDPAELNAWYGSLPQ